MSLRIGVDVDGVLADFRTAFRKASKSSLGLLADSDDPRTSEALGQKEIRRVWEQIGRTSNWWMTLQPYEPDQLARLYGLARAAGWEVFFLTNRPASGGDTVQFQTQWWIERHGFYLPSVLTIPGSRGEVANGLRLDLVIDDLVLNCVEVVSASTAKALLLQRDHDKTAEKHAIERGIGVVPNLEEAIVVIERLNDLLPNRRGRLLRLADWFLAAEEGDTLPHTPRVVRPLPPITEPD